MNLSLPRLDFPCDVTSPPFPPELSDFIARHISSVEKLEILLLVNRDALRPWSLMEVYNAILSTPQSVSRWLDDLAQTGLVQKLDEHSPGRERYQACADEAVKSQVATLDEWYCKTPVRVIEAIYKREARAAQSFADAFRIKKTEEP